MCLKSTGQNSNLISKLNVITSHCLCGMAGRDLETMSQNPGKRNISERRKFLGFPNTIDKSVNIGLKCMHGAFINNFIEV